jgi:PIN domain nuclease of toxin-antitoxin system
VCDWTRSTSRSTTSTRSWGSPRTTCEVVPRRLSIGDRACLALARQLHVPAITAEKGWTGLGIADLTATVIR